MRVLETDRLAIRLMSTDDAEFMLQLLNEPSWLHFIGDRGVRTLDDARNYILNGPIAMYARLGFGFYIVELKDGGIPIGICGLVKRDSLDDVDIGFAFSPAFWSRGYAVESASAVMTYATGVLRLPRVVAVTDPDNLASIRVLETIGLRFSGMARLSAAGPELKLFSSDGEAAAGR